MYSKVTEIIQEKKKFHNKIHWSNVTWNSVYMGRFTMAFSEDLKIRKYLLPFLEQEPDFQSDFAMETIFLRASYDLKSATEKVMN